MIDDIVEIVKSYGPGVAGWVFLLVFVAWILGKGGKLAMSNVKTLLDAGEELRGRYRKSLEECDEQIKARDLHIKVLNSDIETARRTLAGMHTEMLKMQQTHKNDMLELQEEVHNLTLELKVARSLRRRGDLSDDQS